MSWLAQGRRATSSDQPPADFWLSYSDLMAGLLMVFGLMLLAALYHYQAGVAEVGGLVEVRGGMISALQRAFPRGGAVTVDSAGTVRFTDYILFDQGSSEVSRQGREVLQRFVNTYLPVIFGDSVFMGQLKAIVIEGHTNDDGSYRFNLDLSQRRAFSVMMVLLDQAGKYRKQLQHYVTANGRSFAELIRKPDGTVDKVASRRIEIRFQFHDEELLKRLLTRVLHSQQ